jgi:hypothetical protein
VFRLCSHADGVSPAVEPVATAAAMVKMAPIRIPTAAWRPDPIQPAVPTVPSLGRPCRPYRQLAGGAGRIIEIAA